MGKIKKCFISQPMRWETPESIKRQYEKAEKHLKEHGYEAVSGYIFGDKKGINAAENNNKTE